MNTRDTEIEALQNEVTRWKATALYFADCLAATAEQEAITKSVSQCRKKRHFDICRKAVSLIEGKEAPPSARRYQGESEEDVRVLERLREVETYHY